MLQFKTWIPMMLVMFCESKISPTDIARLRKELSQLSLVVAPEDPGFYNASLTENPRFDGILFPLLIIYCVELNDVIQSLRFCLDLDVAISLRSGGHNFAGWCVQNDTVVIDTFRMNTIQFDADSNIAQVGPGVTNLQLFDILAKQKKFFPIGGWPSVAMAGYIQGGGWGLGMRQLGLAIDNLLSATVVLANVTTVVASSDSSSTTNDLFWALRGGGGANFGIVISYQLQIFDIPPQALDVSISWSFANTIDEIVIILAEVVALHQYYLFDTSDPSLYSFDGFAIHVHVSQSTNTTMAGSINMDGMWIGPFVEGYERIAPFLSIGHPQSTIKEKTFEQAVRDHLSGGKDRMTANYWHSGLINKSFSATDFASDWINILHSTPRGLVSLTLESLGGIIKDYPINSTAYPYRKASAQLLCVGSFKNKQEELLAKQLSKDAYDNLTHYMSGVYVNDLDDSLLNWQSHYYGESYAKLQQIKEKYNPNNIFSFPQSIIA